MIRFPLPTLTRHAGARLFLAWRVGLAISLLVTGAAPLAGAGESHTDASAHTLEYQLKAGFLFNFAKFVQWPTTNNLTTNEFRIGILDNGSAFNVLNEALRSKTIEGRPVTVVRVTSTNEPSVCHLLFVTRTAPDDAPEICQQVATLPVLTVGETDGFARRGGCLNLVPQEQRVRFEVNLKAAERAGLKISAKLAGMAIRVEKEEAR